MPVFTLMILGLHPFFSKMFITGEGGDTILKGGGESDYSR